MIRPRHRRRRRLLLGARLVAVGFRRREGGRSNPDIYDPSF